MNAEEIQQGRDRQKAIRQYKDHRLFRILMIGMFGAAGVFLVRSFGLSYDGGLVDLLGIFVLVSGSTFLAEWFAALVFDRKSRPWHFRQHPDDRDPRK